MKLKSLVLAAATALLPMAVWAVPTVSILPAVQHVAQGGNVTATVRIDGLLGAKDQLSAYDLRVSYNSGLLALVSHAFLADAPFGGAANDLEAFSSAAGVATDQATSFLSQADLALTQAGMDGFDLFSLTFKAGNFDTTTNLSFAIVPSLSLPYVLGNSDANPMVATYVGACIGIGAGVCGQINPVPEPETFSLMAIGLLAAGAVGRARRRARTSPASA